MKSVCQNKDVTSSISKNCGANTDAATSWFESACKSAGASVSMCMLRMKAYMDARAQC